MIGGAGFCPSTVAPEKLMVGKLFMAPGIAYFRVRFVNFREGMCLLQ